MEKIKSKHISHFKKGDIITRTKNSENGDRSYVGDKMIFLGIANGVIYLESNDFLASKRRKLPLDWWSNGWDYWKDIDNINENNISFLEYFKNQIDEALEKENYELLEKIKKILNTL